MYHIVHLSFVTFVIMAPDKGQDGNSREKVLCFYFWHFCVVPSVRGKYEGFGLGNHGSKLYMKNITDCLGQRP